VSSRGYCTRCGIAALEQWAADRWPVNKGFFFPLEFAARRTGAFPPTACDAKTAEESPPKWHTRA